MADANEGEQSSSRSGGLDPRALASSPGPWLVLGAIVLAVVTVWLGTADVKEGDEPNRLATSLLQGITLVFGTFGSYLLGKDTSRQAAQEQVRQHARSAFRRVLTLYGALGRLRDKAQTEMDFLVTKVDPAGLEHVRVDIALASLDKLRLMSLEQIATGEDALEDWRDLAPDEVAAIEQKAIGPHPTPISADEEEE